MGLLDCHRSRMPVLSIAVQILSAEIGQQTYRQTPFRECSHYYELVAGESEMTARLRRKE